MPLSKSMAMRAIALQWLIDHTIDSSVAGLCGDTMALSKCLQSYQSNTLTEMCCEASGTALRFLIAIMAATPGAKCIISGTDRLNKRPIGPLVDALRRLGALIEYRGEEGCAPVYIEGRNLDGGEIEVDASVSSQIVSALMLIAPAVGKEIAITLKGTVQSSPYIAMTAAMMIRCGAEVEVSREQVTIAPEPYRSFDCDIEPDWSAAAFWYEIAALTAGWVTLPGLSAESIQGDKAIAPLFERLGVITEFTDEGAELSATPDLYNSLDTDLTDMPDAMPALAITAALAGIPFRLMGIGALHDKECDRVEAVAASLAQLGMQTETEQYGTVFVWDGRRRPINELPIFDTFGDHRIAMALAPVSVFVPGIVVRDVEVVDKSYPGFWEQLRAAGFTLNQVEEVSEA